MNYSAFDALLWSFVGQSLAFSVALVLIALNNRATFVWLIANLLSVIGVLDLTQSVGHLKNHTAAVAAVANLLAPTLRGVAFADGGLLSRRNRPGAILLLAGPVGIALFFCLVNTPYRALVIGASSLLVLTGCIILLMKNRKWRGLPAQSQMIITHVFATLAVVLLLSQAYPFGANERFLGDSRLHITGMTGLIVISFFFQIFFINLQLERKTRKGTQKTQRSSRIAERARVLAASNGTIMRLAEERLSLIRIMTHEVRQPLNNALATLQTVVREFNAGPPDANVVRGAFERMQRVLDDVILSLSNSIVAASIIEWGREPTALAIPAGEALALAALDCPSGDVARLRISQPDEDIYVDADPALLRLALRNLLSNALKYSDPDSEVLADLTVDESRLGIAFSVTNRISDPRLLQGDLVERGKRGGDDRSTGYGLGLYLVDQTARLHGGTLTYWQNSKDEVTFELFLPS